MSDQVIIPTESAAPHPLPPIYRLPPDILLNITRYIERHTALSLARVCRLLTPYAVDQLWRHLDFSKGRRAEQGQETSSVGQADLEEELDWEAEQEDLCRLFKKVVDQDQDRRGKVVSLNTATWPECASALVELLESVSPTLRTLRISLRYREECDDDPLYDSLDISLSSSHRAIGSRVSYPSLTHVVLTYGVINFAESSLLLCQLAPNLVSLDFAISMACTVRLHTSGTATPNLPVTLVNDTKLIELRVDTSDADVHSTGLLPGESYVEPLTSLIALVEHSPHLERLFVFYSSDEEEPDMRLALAASRLANLQDLYWQQSCWTLIAIPPSNDKERSGFTSLRRLVIAYDRWDFPWVDHEDSVFPAVEVVFLFNFAKASRSWSANSANGAPSYLPPSDYQSLEEGEVAWLRNHPRLHYLHYHQNVEHLDHLEIFDTVDAIEQGGNLTATVTCLCHGEGELLMVQLLLYDVEVTDNVEGQEVSEIRRIIYITGKDGVERYDRKVSEPAYQLFTHYEGAAVPPQIIHRMKEVDDPAGTRDWDRRGVEVGVEAWRILADWRAEMTRETEEAESKTRSATQDSADGSDDESD